MLIREAVETDAADIAAVQVNSYRGAYASLMPAEYLEAFSIEEQTQDWVDLIRSDFEMLLAAENEDGKVIGYALAKKIEDGSANFDCELMALHVERAFHRQGVGRALVAETARRMHAAGCKSLGLWVMDGNPAYQFYERLGGAPNGEQFFEIEEMKLRKREIGYRWGQIEDLF